MENKYIGPESQLSPPLVKKELAAPKNPLPAEEVLARRSEEADVSAFFRGEDTKDRELTPDEVGALSEVIQQRIKDKNYKMIPFDFNDEQE